MTARQHHHVSQCYLKGFVRDRDKPRLFVVDLKEQRSFTANPKNVAVERDFHALDVDGLPSDAFENNLADFEGALDTALRRIVAARSITENEDDRAYLFNFVCLLAIKNTALRANFHAAHAQTARIIMDLVTASPERYEAQVRRAKKDGFLSADLNVDYQTMREFVERKQYRLETKPSTHLAMEMQIFEKILPLIFNRKWALFKAPPSGTGFITSDHPVCLSWSAPKERTGLSPPPGLGLMGTQLLFPISNELAMIGAFEIDEDEIEADESLVARINGSVVLHAERQIYARDSDFLYKMQHHSKLMPGASLLDDLAAWAQAREASRPRGEQADAL